ncbi:MAG: response regulator [Acidobacteriota bacterium]|nr:response regulator [Acidobacteriota bacterium]
MQIVIVDDEPSMVNLLASICKNAGHDVVTFTSSNAALNHLAFHRTDLLIADIVMPPPDGLSLISRARAIQSDLLAIAMTGHSGRYRVNDALAAGASDLLFKPFRVDELKARIMLAEERRQAVEHLQEQRDTLHRMSAEMIKGLREELVEARRDAGNAVHAAMTAAAMAGSAKKAAPPVAAAREAEAAAEDAADGPADAPVK